MDNSARRASGCSRTPSIYDTITEKTVNYINSANDTCLMNTYFSLKIKLGRTNKNLYFNSKCLKLKVIPNYVSKNKMFRVNRNNYLITDNLKRRFQTSVLKNELKRLYQVRDSVGFYLLIIRDRLVSYLHSTQWEVFDNRIKEIVCKLMSSKQRTLDRKLSRLFREQRAYKDNKYSQCNNCFPRTFNLSQCSFTQNEIQLLDKGLQFCPKTQIQRKDIVNLAASVESGVEQNLLKFEAASQIKESAEDKSDDNIRGKHHLKSMVTIVKKVKEKDLVIVKSDKGRSTVIMEKYDYLDKTSNLITTTGYTECAKDPTESYNKNIKKALDENQVFCKPEEKSLYVQKNPLPPRLYGAPKIHKGSNCPLRPIVSCIGAPTEKLCKKLVKDFVQLTNFKAKWSIKNSIELVEELKEINLPENCILLSLDVEQMFSNILVEEVVPILKQKLSEIPYHNTILGEEVGYLMELCLGQNYFKFNNKIYIQKEERRSLAMGSPISPLCAEVYMNDFEEKFILNFSNPFHKYIFKWVRYVDDIFCIYNGPEDSLDKFLVFLNSRNNTIRFEMEKESRNAINYLDLTFKKVDCKIKFAIYRKATSSNDIAIPFDSNHPFSQKLAIFHSLLNRLLSIPLEEDNFNNELKYIKHIAVRNGYDSLMVDKMLEKKQRARLITSLFPWGRENNKSTDRWSCIPYLGRLSEKVGNVLRRGGSKVTYKSSKSLRYYLSKPKDPIPLLERSGVYRISCAECGGVYVGRTQRKLKQRMKEHLTRTASNFHKHLHQTGHTGEHQIELLHSDEEGNLPMLEKLEIGLAFEEAPLCFNERNEAAITPLLLSIRDFSR